MSNNKLDKVIHVDSPFEPEKGGFLKAYKKHYKPAYGSNKRIFNDKTSKLEPLPYNIGLKEEMPKLSLESGVRFNLNHEHIFADDDFRMISIQTAKKLGIKLVSEPTLLELVTRNVQQFDSYDAIHFHSEKSKGSYFQASLSDGYLVSIDKINDRSFIRALNKAAQSCAPKLTFNNKKYEPQFKKLEQALNNLNITLNHSKLSGFDHLQEICDLTDEGFLLSVKDGIEPPWKDMAKSPFASFSINHDSSLPFYKPYCFKNEESYLKAGAHVITNAVIDKALKNFHQGIDNPFEFTSKDASLLAVPSNVKYKSSHFSKPQIADKSQIDFEKSSYALLTRDIAGTMFAAQFGVPVTQNDINRFNVYFQDPTFPEQKANQIFDTAIRINSFAKQLLVSKEVNSLTPNNQDLWINWKSENKRFSVQMATPSLDVVFKLNKISFDRNSVIKALNDMTSQKVESIAQSKEPIKAALSKDQSINKAMMTKSISVPADKSKEPQTKGAER